MSRNMPQKTHRRLHSQKDIDVFESHCFPSNSKQSQMNLVTSKIIPFPNSLHFLLAECIVGEVKLPRKAEIDNMEL